MLKTAHKKQQEKDRYKSDQEVQRNLNEIKDDEEHRKKIAGEVADAIAEMERISKEKVKREN
jgi:phage host-nuclease inhibitor protein Gam